MFNCNCGKEYKTEKGFLKHIDVCSYADIDIDKVYMLGEMIGELDRQLFHVHLGTIKKHSKVNEISIKESRKILQLAAIYKYRKTLWDILLVWRDELVVSEYRFFAKWVFKTYKDIALISLRNTLSNTKILYRYHLESTAIMIGRRIDESLLFIHEHGEFSNDFEFTDIVMSGKVSIYYILFNDWLAKKWFGRLDVDMQKELYYNINMASNIIVDRVSHSEYDLLHELACTDTPSIYDVMI